MLLSVALLCTDITLNLASADKGNKSSCRSAASRHGRPLRTRDTSVHLVHEATASHEHRHHVLTSVAGFSLFFLFWLKYYCLHLFFFNNATNTTFQYCSTTEDQYTQYYTCNPLTSGPSEFTLTSSTVTAHSESESALFFYNRHKQLFLLMSIFLSCHSRFYGFYFFTLFF